MITQEVSSVLQLIQHPVMSGVFSEKTVSEIVACKELL